ncbi:MAG: hypothetical protein SNJ64_06960 [Endomicrobiia bacterium]
MEKKTINHKISQMGTREDAEEKNLVKILCNLWLKWFYDLQKK